MMTNGYTIHNQPEAVEASTRRLDIYHQPISYQRIIIQSSTGINHQESQLLIISYPSATNHHLAIILTADISYFTINQQPTTNHQLTHPLIHPQPAAINAFRRCQPRTETHGRVTWSRRLERPQRARKRMDIGWCSSTSDEP